VNDLHYMICRKYAFTAKP